MDWTDIELAYLAGLIDGEGTIAVFRTKAKNKYGSYYRYSQRLHIYNCDKTILDWVYKVFGGRINPVKRKPRKKWRQSWIWSISYLEARTILQRTLPYLVGKKEQAKLFLSYYEIGDFRGRKVPSEVINKRDLIVDKIHILNTVKEYAMG